MERAVICDLDGVVWLSGRPIAGAVDAIAAFRRAGLRVAFLTNNSSRTVAEYVASLAAAGIPAAPDDVLTSAMAAARLLAGGLAPGSRVLCCCAGDGVREAVANQGFSATNEGPAEAVVVGFHRSFDLGRLTRASAAVRAGARFVATNADPTYPTEDGLVPGAGAIVAAVATAGGRSPEVAGKPNAPTVAMVQARFTSGVVVGDRRSTDGALAAALGWPFALVTSEATASTGEPDPGDGPSPEFAGASLAAVAAEILDASPGHRP